MVKHARATDVRVSLGVDDDEVRVEVVDNGEGFDPSAKSKGSGWRGCASASISPGERFRSSPASVGRSCAPGSPSLREAALAGSR